MRIDPTPQGDGIEAGIGLAQGFLVCFGDVGRQKHTLIWRLGRIIRLPQPSVVPSGTARIQSSRRVWPMVGEVGVTEPSSDRRRNARSGFAVLAGCGIVPSTRFEPCKGGDTACARGPLGAQAKTRSRGAEPPTRPLLCWIHHHSVEQQPQHLSPLISCPLFQDVTQSPDTTHGRFQGPVRPVPSA
jgi:hypothetical protein